MNFEKQMVFPPGHGHAVFLVGKQCSEPEAVLKGVKVGAPLKKTEHKDQQVTLAVQIGSVTPDRPSHLDA